MLFEILARIKHCIYLDVKCKNNNMMFALMKLFSGWYTIIHVSKMCMCFIIYLYYVNHTKQHKYH